MYSEYHEYFIRKNKKKITEPIFQIATGLGFLIELSLNVALFIEMNIFSRNYSICGFLKNKTTIINLYSLYILDEGFSTFFLYWSNHFPYHISAVRLEMTQESQP